MSESFVPEILLTVHILAGFAALSAAAVATLTKTLDLAHRWHVYSGTVFFWGMVVVFATALPLAVIRPSPFLFLIAILSFYFALAGWRYATNRRGRPRPVDWLSAGVMALAAVVMIVFGAFLLSRRDTNGITMLILGGVGAALSAVDLRTLRQGGAKGRERIARHLTMMLAGATATLTAFVVTNVPVQPAFIVWLAPTVVITPVIVVWNRRIRAGRRPRGMPESAGTALLLVCMSTFPLAAQESADAPRSAWVVGASIGVPGHALNAEPRLFTLSGHGTQVQPGRLGADLFVGVMPRFLMSGGFAVGARGGVALPLALSEKVLLLPSGGVSVLGALGRGGGRGLAGLNVGVAALANREPSLGFRAGITWHRFRNSNDGIWLMELGVVRRR